MPDKIALITIGKKKGMAHYYKILPLLRQVICSPFDEFDINSIDLHTLINKGNKMYSSLIIYYCPIEINPGNIDVKKSSIRSILSYANEGGKAICDGISSYYFKELGIKWNGIEERAKKWKMSPTKIDNKPKGNFSYKKYPFVEKISLTRGEVLLYLKTPSLSMKKTVCVGKIKSGNGEFWVFSHVGLRLFLFSDVKFLHESNILIGIIQKICDAGIKIMPWKMYSFASMLRDDDIFPFMSNGCVKNQKRIWSILHKNKIPVSLAITPKGSSVYSLDKKNEHSPANFNTVTLSKKLEGFRGLPESEYRWGIMEGCYFIVIRNSETNKFDSLKIDTCGKKDFSRYKTLRFGDSFTIIRNEKPFNFHVDALDDYSNPTRVWFGLNSDINRQFYPGYFKEISSLLKGGFRVQMHGVYHHQHSPVNETKSYGEFYLPGGKEIMPVNEIISTLNSGIETMTEIFGKHFEHVFTDAFGCSCKQINTAISKLKLINFPGANIPSTWILQVPINKSLTYTSIGITHMYNKDINKIKSYWKYAKNTNGIFALAIHSLLGEEEIYSSLTAAKKYMQLNRREAKIFGVWTTTPEEAVKFYKAGLSFLQKINISENKYHNKIKVSFTLTPDLLGLVMKFSNLHYKMKLIEIKGIMKSHIIKINNKWQYVEFNKIGKVKLTLTYKH